MSILPEPKCNCACHRGQNVKHFVACCNTFTEPLPAMSAEAVAPRCWEIVRLSDGESLDFLFEYATVEGYLKAGNYERQAFRVQPLYATPPAVAVQGAVTLAAQVVYPGSKVSDVLIGGHRVQIPNEALFQATEHPPTAAGELADLKELEGYLTSGKFYQNYDRCWELIGSLRKHIAAIQGAAK